MPRAEWSQSIAVSTTQYTPAIRLATSADSRGYITSVQIPLRTIFLYATYTKFRSKAKFIGLNRTALARLRNTFVTQLPLIAH